MNFSKTQHAKGNFKGEILSAEILVRKFWCGNFKAQEFLTDLICSAFLRNIFCYNFAFICTIKGIL